MLATTCPHCQTPFRVNSEQLKLRSGLVRCGACSQVFNGLEHLSYVDTEIEQSGADTDVKPMFERVALDEQPATPTVDRTWAPAAVSTAPSESFSAPSVAAPTNAESHRPRSASNPTEPPAATALAGTAPSLFQTPVSVRRERVLLKVLAGLILLAVVLQALYLGRHLLGQSVPAVRPLLQALCAPLGCQVEWARDAKQISIESVELQQNPNQPERYVLRAVLRNRSERTLAFPALELTLTNVLGRVETRKVLLAEAYVHEPAKTLAQGLPAQTEYQVNVGFKGQGLNANSYNLMVFYP